MSRNAQSILLDAASRLCRARAWLDARLINRERGLAEALKCVADVRGMLESVELTLGREAAVREEMSQTLESI